MANLYPAPSNRTMWRAYAFAPAVTPIAFVVLLAFVGLSIPVPAFAAVVVICYSVAGLIGMPIAFLLRRLNALNAYAIHGAAFCWGAMSSFACTIAIISVAAAIGGTWNEGRLITIHFSLIVPPVVLSGTGFWFLLRKMAADEHRASSKDTPSLDSQDTADNNAMNRSAHTPAFC